MDNSNNYTKITFILVIICTLVLSLITINLHIVKKQINNLEQKQNEIEIIIKGEVK